MIELLPKPHPIFCCRISMVHGTYSEKDKSANAVNPRGGIFNRGLALLKQKVSCRNRNQSRYKMSEEINGFPELPHKKLFAVFVFLSGLFGNLIKKMIHSFYIFVGIIYKES